jgi:hypothetical protein
MRRHRLVLGFLLAVTARVSVVSAQTESGRVTLRWNAPHECPDTAALALEIEAYLGQKLDERRPQDLAVDANVQGSAGDGYSAKVVFGSARGVQERYLDHPDCGKLTEATALVVALAIDPERVAQQQATSDVAPAPASPTPTPDAPGPRAASEERASSAPAMAASSSPSRDRTSIEVMARLGGAVAIGRLPSLGPGLDAEIGLRRERFRADVVGRYWLPRAKSVPEAPEGSIQLSLATVGVRVCGAPLLADWSLWACAGADVGAMTGVGVAIDGERSRSDRFSSLAASVSAAYGRGRLAPFGGLELGYALERPPFGVLVNGRFRETFRSDAWALGSFLGLQLDP